MPKRPKPVEFEGSDVGLPVPARRINVNTFGLRITNLDRGDPPSTYHDGGVPRTRTFNRNVLVITGTPRKPAIPVHCEVTGFDPAVTPIYWRLQTLHVMCRYKKVRSGTVGIPSNYASRVTSLADEWGGQVNDAAFTIFPLDEVVSTDDGSDRVSGGHAILTVAARPQGADAWLQDFVHLRIGAYNPLGEKDDVRAEIARLLGARGQDLLNMLYAILEVEAPDQFKDTIQQSVRFKSLGTRFEWPADPPDYPLGTFDFGVGYFQFTDPDALTTAIAWDGGRT